MIIPDSTTIDQRTVILIMAFHFSKTAQVKVENTLDSLLEPGFEEASLSGQSARIDPGR